MNYKRFLLVLVAMGFCLNDCVISSSMDEKNTIQSIKGAIIAKIELGKATLKIGDSKEVRAFFEEVSDMFLKQPYKYLQEVCEEISRVCGDDFFSDFIQRSNGFLFTKAFHCKNDLLLSYFFQNAEKYKINLNFRDENGMTMMMLFARRGGPGSINFIECLRNHGALLDLVDGDGKSAYVYARIRNDSDLQEYFYRKNQYITGAQIDYLRKHGYLDIWG